MPGGLLDEEEINFKILYSYYKGFFVQCCGNIERTSIKVAKLPYFLDMNSVIQVGNSILLAVEKINPLPKRPEDPNEGILLSTIKHKTLTSIFGLETAMKSIDSYKEKLRTLKK